MKFQSTLSEVNQISRSGFYSRNYAGKHGSELNAFSAKNVYIYIHFHWSMCVQDGPIGKLFIGSKYLFAHIFF